MDDGIRIYVMICAYTCNMISSESCNVIGTKPSAKAYYRICQKAFSITYLTEFNKY